MVALGLRLGLLTPAPSLKRARGDRVPKSSPSGDTVCLGKMSKKFVVTRGETPQLTELVQHARSFTWPVVSGSAHFEARNALTAAMSLHDEVKRLHERLGGWAIVGAGYVSHHIQRKTALAHPRARAGLPMPGDNCGVAENRREFDVLEDTLPRRERLSVAV